MRIGAWISRHLMAAVLLVALGAAVGEVFLGPKSLAAQSECCFYTECVVQFGTWYCQMEQGDDRTNCVTNGVSCYEEECQWPYLHCET